MAGSLQDQLLKSGAAKPKQAKKAKREKVKRDQAARQQGKTPQQTQALAQEIAVANAAKRERDRQLNAQRKAEREAREHDQWVTQIIERYQLAAGSDSKDTVAYSYTIANKIRRIEVSDSQRRDLAAGRLATVRHRGKASLIPRAAAERLIQHRANSIWLVSSADDSDVDPNDPYADYPVPDDLIW